jgi:hypothetical protein
MFQCDFCGEDTGPFNDAGNHPVCVELAASQARVKELEEALLWIADLAGGSLDGDAKRDAVIEKVARATLAAPAEKGKQL